MHSGGSGGRGENGSLPHTHRHCIQQNARTHAPSHAVGLRAVRQNAAPHSGGKLNYSNKARHPRAVDFPDWKPLPSLFHAFHFLSGFSASEHNNVCAVSPYERHMTKYALGIHFSISQIDWACCDLRFRWSCCFRSLYFRRLLRWLNSVHPYEQIAWFIIAVDFLIDSYDFEHVSSDLHSTGQYDRDANDKLIDCADTAVNKLWTFAVYSTTFSQRKLFRISELESPLIMDINIQFCIHRLCGIGYILGW